MWNEITNEQEMSGFLECMDFFHDSCIKEMNYTSGAYVAENLTMYPVNDQRALHVILQRQFRTHPVVELEFLGLRFLKLSPADAQDTCEILDCTLLQNNGCFYWADCGGLSAEELEQYDGTVICAEKMRWRALSGALGEAGCYRPAF